LGDGKGAYAFQGIRYPLKKLQAFGAVKINHPDGIIDLVDNPGHELPY
jgi:hypothetical protein